MHKAFALSVLFPLIAFTSPERITVNIFATDNNTPIGRVVFEESEFGGVLVTPALEKLPAGVHGFHIHTMSSCENHGNAAGGHLDPAQNGIHLGPYDNNGHLGDLPVLVVNADGTASLPVLAPRLKVSDLPGHTVMVHEGGDNYSDKPKPLGGGGARIACGIIK